MLNPFSSSYLVFDWMHLKIEEQSIGLRLWANNSNKRQECRSEDTIMVYLTCAQYVALRPKKGI
jgi:hypothetical protein